MDSIHVADRDMRFKSYPLVAFREYTMAKLKEAASVDFDLSKFTGDLRLLSSVPNCIVMLNAPNQAHSRTVPLILKQQLRRVLRLLRALLDSCSRRVRHVSHLLWG